MIDGLRRLAEKLGGNVDICDQVRVGLWIPDRAAVPALREGLERMPGDFEEWWLAE